MSRSWKSRALMAGLAGAVLRLACPVTCEAGPLPKDPCALLKPAEIQALAPNAKIGKGVLDTSGAPLGTGCRYSWGPRTSEWGESSVSVNVIDASKAWIGVSPDAIKQGLVSKARTGGPNASPITGVGDAAVFTFEARSSNASAEAFLKAKGLHLSVVYHAGDSLQSKDKVIALLKDAAGRL